MPIIQHLGTAIDSGGSGGGGGGIVTTNLVLHLDASNSSSYSGSGTTWSDLASSSLNATLVNGVTFSSDNGGTFVFDGTNDYAEITSASALGGFSGDFTIEFWYKATNEDSYDTLFDFNGENSSTVFRWGVQAAPGGSNMTLRRDSAFAITTSGIDAFDDNWHHHVIARNGSTITYYIDNVSRGTETYSGSISSGTHLKIGGFSGGGYHIGGSLPQVRIYDGTGFTASQVLQNYNASNNNYTIVTTDLILHLDTRNSDSYSGSGTAWNDLSGQGNHATLVNSPAFFTNFGGNLRFDGNNDYATLPDMDLTGNELTFSIWNQTLDNQNSSIIFLGDSNAPSGGRILNIHLPFGNNYYYFDKGYDGSSYDRLSGPMVNSDWQNQWVHWTFTANASTGSMKIYRNASLYASGTGYTRTFSNSNGDRKYIATSSGGSGYYEAYITQILLYKKELTASEVLHNYNIDKSTYGH